MITEKQKQFVIEQMKPFDPIEIRVFENTPTSVGFFYHFKKPCGLDFVDIWDAIEDKFQKQARFVRIPDIAITHPYDQKWILKNKELFYSNESIKKTSEHIGYHHR